MICVILHIKSWIRNKLFNNLCNELAAQQTMLSARAFSFSSHPNPFPSPYLSAKYCTTAGLENKMLKLQEHQKTLTFSKMCESNEDTGFTVVVYENIFKIIFQVSKNNLHIYTIIMMYNYSIK